MTKHIGQFLNNFIPKQYAWKEKIFENWPKIIGSLADKVYIKKIEGRFLILSVVHPVWAQELFLLSDVLKKKINSFLDKDYITEIRFNCSDFKDVKKRYEGVKRKKINLPKLVCLSENESKVLLNIKDVELRDSMEKFFLCCKRWNNGKKK